MSEKKYYAVECDPEFFRYEDYYDEDSVLEDNLWVGGNRDFCELNADLRKGVVSKLENLRYDLGVVLDDYTDDDCNITDQAGLEAERLNTVATYFAGRTTEECYKLMELAERFHNCYKHEENDVICEVLAIIYKEEFKHTVLHGYCQGDWLEVIYPASKKDRLPWIEAVLFATGTEFRISEEPITEEEFENEDYDAYHDYTEKWDNQDIKDWLCKTIGCKSEELVVKKISKSYNVRHFEYEEF